jgi:hypothetical protein
MSDERHVDHVFVSLSHRGDVVSGGDDLRSERVAATDADADAESE